MGGREEEGEGGERRKEPEMKMKKIWGGRKKRERKRKGLEREDRDK